jgi:hypothetical protein
MQFTLDPAFWVRPQSMLNSVLKAIKPIFEELEDRYGPMDSGIRLECVRFVPADDSKVYCDKNGLRIQLYRKYLSDEQWIGVLAHEAVHCLGHVAKAHVTYLEEGVAELFSTDYFARLFPGKTPAPSDPKYHTAAGYVRQLESHRNDIIKAARAMQPALSRITGKHLLELCPTLPAPLIDALVSHFDDPSKCNQPIEQSLAPDETRS